MPRLLRVLFLLVIAGVPLGQAVHELVAQGRIQALELRWTTDQAALRDYEQRLREASFVHRAISPWYQWCLCELLQRGNEKAVIGRAGWIYYGPDLDLITRPPGPTGAERALACISDLHQTLAARGIELLLLPMPGKGMVDGEHLSRWTSACGPIWPEAAIELLDGLTRKGIAHCDLRALLLELGSREGACYLEQDTHWTAATMHAAARLLAQRARALLGEAAPALIEWEPRVESLPAQGDLLGMLRLPAGRDHALPWRIVRLLPPPEAAQPVDDPAAPILLLGDSFSGVYSEPKLGLGEGAGLAEHLAAFLGRSIDRIVIPGSSARGVREALARRADRPAEEGGLAGKRLVIWQISMRDLASGPEVWEPVPLADASAAPAAGTHAARELDCELVATVPMPEAFDYAFGLAVYGYRPLGSQTVELVWVAQTVVEDYRPTPAASYRPGQRFHLRLEPIESHYDLETTSWFRHPDMDLRAPIFFAVEERLLEEDG